MSCSEADYAYLRGLVRKESANEIDPSRNALFDTRLTPMARLAGARNLQEFVEVLRADNESQLHRAVAEAMTINETSFFRDRLPFEMLRETVLPELIARRRKERRLRIWSAACSTGQEAYSVAMLLRENFPQLMDWDVKIIGTDISKQVVEAAKAGRYRRIEVNRGLPVRLLVKYLERDGEVWVMSPAMREMCEFVETNLCNALTWLPVFDLVLLRNVLLYFPRQERAPVFAEVRRHMTADGYLLLGNAEQAEDCTKLFEVQFASGCFVYRPSCIEW
jgi:chemotaxis protein methyltransferase CheR